MLALRNLHPEFGAEFIWRFVYHWEGIGDEVLCGECDAVIDANPRVGWAVGRLVL